MIVAGIGCRKGAPQEDILAAIAHALEAATLTPGQLDLIATAAEKGGEDGIAAAAAAFGCPLVLVPARELQIAGEKAITRSERVVALFAVPSVAEAAALAAAGDGARLIAPRRVAGMATCAIAASGDDSEGAL
ncbi:cobalamin biosynthesis protein [Mesorhizobium sp. BR1-1-16]|uniref:cobalamin biosynthesis protein n=1 Tax=Mesorhizobium sp. BR1-1-16 TaxID=2876653 RepID=UPI001CCEC1E8|nr:cobalamin biosynthesis protein [Mesorhizobium sp. BR1-1-16]MBZ9936268.1 cobalamin biosynthesis protein [Mesorhizobium sp. BR1-1-16]